MPGCSTAKNPHNITITFTEDDHKYTSIINGKEINYISGTTFIKKFFPEFDPTGEITKRCAKKAGITVEEQKKLWREKADKSCIFGTRVHECMEDKMLGRPLRNTPKDSKEELVFPIAEKLSNIIIPKVEILGVEKIIFDENLRIAGTIDFLAKSKKDGKIWICDWKTNSKIEKENKYHNFALYPIDHIPALNFYEYGMQLNLYEYLLKTGEYIDKNAEVGKVLFHITEEGSKTYVLPDYQKEISDMIKIHQLTLKNEQQIKK